MTISQTEDYFENPSYHFFRGTYALSVEFNGTSKEKRFLVLGQKLAQILQENLLKGATIRFDCLFDESAFLNICTL